jgi:hypothetical protein
MRETLHELPANVGAVNVALETPSGGDDAGYFVTIPAPEPGARYAPFAGGIVLMGQEIGADGVALHFRAVRPLLHDAVISLQVPGAEPADSVPVQGAIPTLKWLPGIPITHRETLDPSGGLYLTLYDHFTGRVYVPLGRASTRLKLKR